MVDEKKIVETYTSLKVPRVDLGSKVIGAIKAEKRPKKPYHLRTVAVFLISLMLTSTLVFALVQIVHNADGSHTLLDEKGNKTWTVVPKTGADAFDHEEWQYLKKLIDGVNKRRFRGDLSSDKAVAGYYKYSDEKPELFLILAANKRFNYDEAGIETMKVHKDTPDYLFDLADGLEAYFGVSSIQYSYSPDPQVQMTSRGAMAQRAQVGQMLVEVVDAKSQFSGIKYDLWSKDIGRFRDTSLSISSESVSFSSTEYEVDYESLSIDGHPVLISQRQGQNYLMAFEVKGLGISLYTKLKGERQDLIEMGQLIIDLLE